MAEGFCQWTRPWAESKEGRGRTQWDIQRRRESSRKTPPTGAQHTTTLTHKQSENLKAWVFSMLPTHDLCQVYECLLLLIWVTWPSEWPLTWKRNCSVYVKELIFYIICHNFHTNHSNLYWNDTCDKLPVAGKGQRYISKNWCFHCLNRLIGM